MAYVYDFHLGDNPTIRLTLPDGREGTIIVQRTPRGHQRARLVIDLPADVRILVDKNVTTICNK